MGTTVVDANGIHLSVTVEGPDGGQPVLLLHGFPDSHLVRRHQVAALAAAPDQLTRLLLDSSPDGRRLWTERT